MVTVPRSILGVLVLLFILSVIPMPAVAGDQVIGSPEISVYSPDNEFNPGQEATLPVYISNTGNLRQAGPDEYVERVTTARGMTIEAMGKDNPIEINTGRYPVGSVSEGTDGPYPLSITVADDAQPGTYEIPVRVKYSYTILVDYSSSTPEFSNSFHNQIHYLTVRVRDTPQFSVVNTTSTTRVDSRGNMSVTIRNGGTNSARDATLQLNSTSDEIRFGTRSRSSRAFAGVWEPGANRTFEFTTTVSSDAVTREYPLSGRVIYDDQNGVQKLSRELTTGITPKEKQTFDVENVSSTLYVGEPGTIHGTVTNTGQEAVRNAVLVYTSSNPNIAPDETEIALGRLAPGEQSEFVFEVGIAGQAAASTQQLNLTVRYRDSHGNQQMSDSLEPSVTLLSEREWLTVTPGETTFGIDTDNRMTVHIRNDEQIPLTDVQIRLGTEEPFSTDSQLAYVQNLQPNETTTLAFGVTVSEDAVATQSSVTLNVTAERPDGKDIYIDQYLVPVTVAEDTSTSNTTLLAAGALLVLVVFAGGLWWLRH